MSFENGVGITYNSNERKYNDSRTIRTPTQRV